MLATVGFLLPVNRYVSAVNHRRGTGDLDPEMTLGQGGLIGIGVLGWISAVLDLLVGY